MFLDEVNLFVAWKYKNYFVAFRRNFEVELVHRYSTFDNLKEPIEINLTG